MAAIWKKRLYLSEPVISKITNIVPSVISKKIDSSVKGYRKFSIPKHQGGRREILSPRPSLACVQTAIATRLHSCVDFSESVHAYVPKKSVITNALAHVEGKNFLKVDIENFFPSITSSLIRRTFSDHCHNDKTMELLLKFCTLKNSLPQGAPSSPMISNIVMGPLDEILGAYSKSNSLNYTRYADDIIISGDKITIDDRDTVYSFIENYGLTVNAKKSVLINSGRKVIITGISISRNRLCVPRKSKRKIRQQAHLVVKNGIIHESKKKGVFDPFYVDRVLGRLSFWNQVEPNNPYPIKHLALIKGMLSDLVK